MRQSERLISNGLTNLIGYVSRLLAVFLLPPFVISIIGKENYGVIVIATTMMAFISLIQLGTPISLSRYLSEATAEKNRCEFIKILNAGAIILSLAGFLTLVATGIIVLKPQLFITVPANLPINSVRTVIGLMGCLTSVSLPLSIGNVLYYVRENFRLLNGLQILGTLIRVLLVLILVSIYQDSIAYVAGHAISMLATAVTIFIVGLRLFEDVKFGFKFLDLRVIKKIMGYGFAVFIYSSLYLFYIQADYIIVGKTIDAEAVTILNLAVVWGISLRGIIVAIVSVSAPFASKKRKLDDVESLKIMFIRVTKYSLLTSIPGILFLCVFSHSLMFNWMGIGYDESAYIMIYILIGEMFVIAEAGGSQIMLGTGKLKFLTVTNIIFGVLNVLFSYLACTLFNFGIRGVAFIYMVLLFIRSGLLTPSYMARNFSIPIRQLYRKAYLGPLSAAVIVLPFIIAMSYVIKTNNWPSFIAVGFLTFLAYLVSAYFTGMDTYDKELLIQMLNKVGSSVGSR